MPLFTGVNNTPEHRVKLFPPYEIRDHTGTLKYADLRRDTYRERTNLIVLVGKSSGSPHEWEVEISSTEALKASMSDVPTLVHAGIVSVAMPGMPFVRTKIYRHAPQHV